MLIAVLVGIETLLRRFFYSIQVRAGFGCGGLGCIVWRSHFGVFTPPLMRSFLFLLLYSLHILSQPNTPQHNTTQHKPWQRW